MSVLESFIDAKLREQIGFLKVLSFANDDTPISILAADDEDNPIHLAKWRIIKPTTPSTYNFTLAENFISAHIRRLTGVGSITAKLGISQTDIDAYNTVSTISGTAASFQAQGTSANRYISSATDEFISIQIFNSDGATTGEIKNLAGLCSLVLPTSFTVVRLI